MGYMGHNLGGGYNGKILRVNLTDKTFKIEDLERTFCRQYIGGAGFITYWLWKELKPGVDALSSDNKLIFANGPVSGLVLPGAARNCVGAKSPLTGAIAKSEAGGFWAAELKRAGFDAIIIEGKSENPVYLWIQDGRVVFKDAAHLWGLETREVQNKIRLELGDQRIHAAMIGPAGENLVRYSCIMHGLNDSAGRSGLGAVMGSKNLKAVALRGHHLPPVAQPERVKEIRLELTALRNPISEYGSGGPEMPYEEKIGNLPVRNYRDGLFPEVSQINGGNIRDTLHGTMDGCFACPIRCKKVVGFEEPYKVDPLYGGPEYESLVALGADCGISDLKAIIKGNELCNAFSMDTISTGNTIAFAMECFEKGLITKKDTGGIELKFGNPEAMLQAIKLIAKREGIGALLAEGTARMAKTIGHGSEKFAMNVKGLEAAMHDPRVRPGLELGYSLNPWGADHCSSLFDDFVTGEGIKDFHSLGFLMSLPMDDISPRKVAVYRANALKSMLTDTMVVCMFSSYPLHMLEETMKAVTGWDTGLVELTKVSERILTLSRLFNIREGFTSADDMLPERFFQPKTDGVLINKYLDKDKYEKAKSFFYASMGWDKKGIPLPAKVVELYID
jgi:aldehyde:ferredoxin oxidoreductase